MPVGHWSNGPTWLAANAGVLWSLPNHDGRVAVVEQDAADGRLVLGDDAVVAGEAGRLLRDHAEAHRVVVASRDQRGARRRAQRRREHAVVAQAFLCDAVHRRCRDHAAERARHAEAGVVGDDQEHVRRALRRHDARRPPRFGLQGIVLDRAAELRIRRGQLLGADRRGSAWRARGAVDLLTGGEWRHGRKHCQSQDGYDAMRCHVFHTLIDKWGGHAKARDYARPGVQCNDLNQNPRTRRPKCRCTVPGRTDMQAHGAHAAQQ